MQSPHRNFKSTVSFQWVSARCIPTCTQKGWGAWLPRRQGDLALKTVTTPYHSRHAALMPARKKPLLTAAKWINRLMKWNLSPASKDRINFISSCKWNIRIPGNTSNKSKAHWLLDKTKVSCIWKIESILEQTKESCKYQFSSPYQSQKTVSMKTA